MDVIETKPASDLAQRAVTPGETPIVLPSDRKVTENPLISAFLGERGVTQGWLFCSVDRKSEVDTKIAVDFPTDARSDR
ncbi:hypothetical protein [Mesorhizobium humile]|uniref:Uncharacterized protein n=1 Tax=Mesorhizobium humile TaxID=3072313 RepID=A0ABU4YIS5_9HYPH|nr:hypothetical protein [Mesorhizobium sp. VK2D]MDX8486854.1 hypothetical protein [Mesorhizobium sp. VK2B]